MVGVTSQYGDHVCDRRPMLIAELFSPQLQAFGGH